MLRIISVGARVLPHTRQYIGGLSSTFTSRSGDIDPQTRNPCFPLPLFRCEMASYIYYLKLVMIPNFADYMIVEFYDISFLKYNMNNNRNIRHRFRTWIITKYYCMLSPALFAAIFRMTWWQYEIASVNTLRLNCKFNSKNFNPHSRRFFENIWTKYDYATPQR